MALIDAQGLYYSYKSIKQLLIRPITPKLHK